MGLCAPAYTALHRGKQDTAVICRLINHDPEEAAGWQDQACVMLPANPQLANILSLFPTILRRTLGSEYSYAASLYHNDTPQDRPRQRA